MSIRVVHGINEGYFEFANQTVAKVARSLKEVFNIRHDASAFLNGEEVSENHLLSDGDNLEFVATVGQKGGLHDLWSERELADFFGEERMKLLVEAGVKLTLRPSLSSAEFISWNNWLQDQTHDPAFVAPASVDVDNERIAVHGNSFEIDTQLAAVVKCLLDAKGERRSCQDMKRLYPSYIIDDRLDTTIRRRLMTHKSGIGDFIDSDTRGYRLKSGDEVE